MLLRPAESPPPVQRLWLLYAIAAASFLPAIGFHYVGEEAIFPISSLEMWYRGEWVEQVFLGGSLQHNPLFNWLIIPLASLAGWEHMLAIARAITIAATVGTGLVLAWLCATLYRDAVFAAFAALVYLTLADVFFYRGWLAYADPLFAFFTFAAVACLWAGCLRQSAALLALAVTALTCAFMTKALTAYAFYGVTAAALAATDRRHRAFLLERASWALHALGAALPVAWLYLVPGNVGQGGCMFGEVLAKLAPALFVAAYYCWWRGRAAAVGAEDRHFRAAFWSAFVNYLPYWLAPQSSIRYLMPLYPLAGLLIARLLWCAGARAVTVTQRWLIVVVVAKLVVMLAVFPYYQKQYRGENYATAARDIMERTRGYPLYANNVSASGLSVTAHLDILRLPAPPLTFPPSQWESGFVINHTQDPALGKVAMQYRLGGNNLYLLCRGAACEGKR